MGSLSDIFRDNADALRRSELQTRAWRQLRQVRAEMGATLLRQIEWEDQTDPNDDPDGVACHFCAGGDWVGPLWHSPPQNKTPDPPGQPKHRDDCPLAKFLEYVRTP